MKNSNEESLAGYGGEGPGFPSGMMYVFAFVAFNALSFQIILSSPMVLFVKSLGGSSTLVGVLTGITPLLVVLQIPGAHFMARFGYRKFVMTGWAVRTLFVFGVASLALGADRMVAGVCLTWVMVLMTCFNICRGIAGAGWLPWVTSLVPLGIRGRYLVWDGVCVNLSGFLMMILSSYWLGDQPGAFEFGTLFFWSGVMGVLSVGALLFIPEVEAPEERRASTTAVPWKAIAGYRPFKKLLILNVVWAVAFGGINAFTVSFLRVEEGWSEKKILLLNSALFVGGLVCLTYLHRRLDRHGSRPMILMGILVWCGIMLGWGLIAGKWIKGSAGWILALEFAMGAATSLVQLSNTRLAMQMIPTMGRSHFFALFSVVGNLTLGLSPMAWGIFLDAFLETRVSWGDGGFEWNRYSLFFFSVLGVFGLNLWVAYKQEEPGADGLWELLGGKWKPSWSRKRVGNRGAD